MACWLIPVSGALLAESLFIGETTEGYCLVNIFFEIVGYGSDSEIYMLMRAC